MTFLDDSERQLYLRFRGNIRQKYMDDFKVSPQTAENHYGKTISREAKTLIKDKREKEKVDMKALLRDL